MTLLADAVGLDQPGGEFVVNLLGRIQPERVQDISRRVHLDLPEPRAVDPASENEVRGSARSVLRAADQRLRV